MTLPCEPVSVHFLGDNNSLAQAISRALAESLPSHGDSSRRTTNMAESAGPLISAMKSEAVSGGNLPLVVGGCRGGSIGSGPSTFPSLNKAFVVGPGYAPV